MSEINIKATLQEILEGRIIIDKKVYSIKYLHDLDSPPKTESKNDAVPSYEKIETEPEVDKPNFLTENFVRSQYSKGEVLEKTSTIDINSNVYYDLLYAIKTGKSTPQLIKILAPYYPRARKSSLKTYLGRYRQAMFHRNPETAPLLGNIQRRASTKPIPDNLPDRGKVIGKDSFISYYENIFEEVKEALQKEQNKKQIAETVLKKYYPYVSQPTRKNYAGRYMKKAIKKIDRQQPPEDSYAYNKSYGVWIQPEDVKEIKKAILHVAYDYKPTPKNIIQQAGLKHHRAMATLQTLKKENKIKRTIDDKGDFVYAWVE